MKVDSVGRLRVGCEAIATVGNFKGQVVRVLSIRVGEGADPAWIDCEALRTGTKLLYAYGELCAL